MLFFKCMKCGNFITFIGEKTPCTPMCCGEQMTEIIPNTTDGAAEKHVPDVKIDGQKVKIQVGSVIHPALPEHHIDFIILETDKGYYKRDITPGDEPSVEFTISADEKPVAAYENCNLHGLWKADI